MSEFRTRALARSTTINVKRLAARQLLPILFAICGVWLLKERAADLDLSAVKLTFLQVQFHQWGAAIAATAASFWAIGRYDAVMHGLLGTGVSRQAARSSGACAIAIAQFAGFGLLTSALVRWRLVPIFSLWQSFRLSLAVTLSFLAGWAVLTAIVVLTCYSGSAIADWLALGVIAVFVAATTLCFLDLPRLPKMPPVQSVASILSLVSIDLTFAGLALFLLLPDGVTIDLFAFLPIFLIAFGLGLICGTPGGIGPFELVLLALLPLGPAEPILASVLAFRLVYYSLPAALATILLFKNPRQKGRPAGARYIRPFGSANLSQDIEKFLWRAPRADANLIRQSEFGLLTYRGNLISPAAPVGQSLVLLGAPFSCGFKPKLALKLIQNAARTQQRAAVVYKCDARFATVARKSGWSVAEVVREAWIDPRTFSTTGPEHRQLRRLRSKAEKLGVSVHEAGSVLPLQQMHDVAQAWAKRHGGERGFSMGRFDQDYVRCQRVFLAYLHERLVGYLTLHETQNEWAVDLMRHDAAAPDGTMHLLICQALKSAHGSRIARFSLAGVPSLAASQNPVTNKIRRYIFDRSGAAGLRRFKECFAPNWSPLFAVAPSKLALTIGLFDILRQINRIKPRAKSKTNRRHS